MSKLDFRLMISLWTVCLLIGGKTCLADAALDSVLQNALKQEQKLVTGRIVLDVEHIEPKLSLEQIQTLKLTVARRNSDTSKQRDFEEFVSVEKKSASESHIAFDNRTGRLIAQCVFQPGPYNVKENKAVYDPDFSKTYAEFPDLKSTPGGKVVSVMKHSDNAEDAELWRQRTVTHLLHRIEQHRGVAKLVSLNANTGQAVVSWNVLGHHSKMTTLFYFDTHNQYFISRVQGVDASGSVCYESIAIPQSYPGGIVYPSRDEETYYYPTQTGGGVAYMHQISTVRSAEINIPLKDSTFDFGKYPRNSRVNDSRFPKPVVYNQGIVQFTDEQLFQATKDPDYLMNLELEAQRKEAIAAPPPRAPLSSLAWQIIALEVAGVAALLLLIGLGLWRWRSAASNTGRGQR